MIREVADVDPLPPAFAGRPHLVDGLVVGLGRGMLRKTQRDEDVVALFQPRARPRLAALQPDAQVGGQPQRRVRVRVVVGPRNGFPIATGRVLPVRAGPVVIERRLAVHHQLDGAAHAAHGAQQGVFGVPVHRYAAMRPRPRLDVAPRAHHHRVADDHPAGVGLPGGLQDQAARQVTPGGRDRDAVRAQPEVPGAAIQDGPEHAGRIGPGHAQPFHRSTRGDQAAVLAVGEEGVVGDGRKGVPQTARRVWHRGGRVELHGGAVLVGGRRMLQDHVAIIDRRPLRRTRLPLPDPARGAATLRLDLVELSGGDVEPRWETTSRRGAGRRGSPGGTRAGCPAPAELLGAHGAAVGRGRPSRSGPAGHSRTWRRRACGQSVR